jgi:hypothetical protein
MKTLNMEGNPSYINASKTHFSSFCIKFILLAFAFFSLVTPANAINITLQWDPNSESDLAGYKVYYKTGSSGEPYNGTSADQGPSPITVLVEDLDDPNAPAYALSGLDENKVYFFSVTAYNDSYLESVYSEEADIFSISLTQGSNLISLCRQPDNTDIETILHSISGMYVSIWTYKDNSWQGYDPANPGAGELTSVEAGTGYWINMNESGTLVIADSSPSNSIGMVRGLNLVGYNSTGSLDTAPALASIDGNYLSVWAFINGNWKFYDPANPTFSDLTTMEPNYGYWINTSAPCTWTVP